jgi:hypothetical protein
MVALQEYAQLTVFINGQNVQQLTSVERTTDSGQQRVELLNEGLGGFTPGSGSVTISLGFAIPIGGTEFDYDGLCVDGSYVTMQVSEGSKSYVGTGKITNVSLSQNVGAASEGTLEWTGQFKKAE